MIRFERVTYTYPFQTCPAVSDISFSVRPGELVLCTGASGCGKSTLMRLANGLCPHYFQGTLEGRVLIGGEPTDARPINAIAREVGTLFQDPEQQFFALNVEDELAFAHEWQGVSPESIAAKIDEAARAFRLGPILSSSIHELSEGQKQKVGLASILSQGPRALILDEPSANLDPEATEDLARKLTELKARGMAILVVDHRLYWLEGIADRVLVMREGRIAERGGFDLLYDDALRGRCGLRAARVDDPRRTLPDCAAELLEPGEGGLAVSGLRFAYPGKPALFDGVDVSIPAGVTALIGDNGTGKTSLAHVIAETTKATFVEVSAIGGTVSDLRREIDAADKRLSAFGLRTILFVDEIHRFNRSQQDALLHAVEDRVLVLVGATTENPFFEVPGCTIPAASSNVVSAARPSPPASSTMASRALASNR